MRNMTKGNLAKHMIAYAIPMILGNILQLSYNAVDSMIIGKKLGENALAAVSTANPIMTIMILGVSGLSLGGSVIMSRFYGAGDHDALKKEFSTVLLFSFFLSTAVFILGLIFTMPLLKLMNTPVEIQSLSARYFRIICFGFLFTFLYNVLSAAMRSIGDSSTPIFFLGLSCLINGCLDVLLIYVFHMGVAGAGLATVLAEMTSVAACMVFIRKKLPLLALTRKDLKIERSLLSETLKIGSLTALQQAAQPVGKVLIQRTINELGVTAIGAFNAVCRLDDFACLPTQSIGNAIMTCTAQNRGAKNKERVDKTLGIGLRIALGYFPIICGLTLLCKRPFVSLLVPAGSEEMLRMGTAYLSVKAWFFVMPCMTNAVQGYFRGMARMTVVFLATLTQISIRTLMVWILVPRMGIVGEAYACLIGWLVMLIWESCYYFRFRKTVTFE